MASPIREQVVPAASTLTTLYTVGAGVTYAQISSIRACNRAGATPIRIAISPLGTSIADAHYEIYDFSLPANNRMSCVEGITLKANDVVRVYSGSGSVNFHISGLEV